MMISSIIILLLTVILTPLAQATTYYVSTSGNDSTGDGSSSAPWRNPQKCVASGSPLVAGDVCEVGDGTYTVPAGQSGRVIIITSSSPNGTASAPITIRAANRLGATISAPDNYGATDCNVSSCVTAGIYMSGRNYYTFEGFRFTRTGSGYATNMSTAGISLISSTTGVVIRHNHFYDIGRNVCHNGVFGQAGVFAQTPTDFLIEHNTFNKIGRLRNGESGCSTDKFQHDHGIYIERGTNVTIRRNVFYDVNRGFPINIKSRQAGSKSLNYFIYNNTISGKAPGDERPNGQIGLTNTFENINIKNNTFHDPPQNHVLWWHTDSTPIGAGVIMQYNLTNSTDTEANLSNDYLRPASGVTISNNTMNTNPGFVDSANGDFRLASGSGSINVGTNVGLSYSGSAPDAGAYESYTHTSASIDGRTLTITTNAVFTPLQPTSGSSGWAVGCTGTGCGTPVVSSVLAKVGETASLALDISGITGGNCAVGQTWTVTYSSSTGTVTDSITIVGSANQHLFSFTTFSVTNACTGAPPAPPAGVTIQYPFNEGTGTTVTDSAGGDQNGTLIGGATWATGAPGVVLTAQSGQHVAIPYGDGVDPSSQSLTIAFEVDVTPGNEGLSRSYFGAPLGTNQRLFITTLSGTWRIGIQSSNAAAASDLPVHAGKTYVCLILDSSTDTATLYIDGVAATASGGVKTYTSYSIAGDFDLGQIAGLNDGGGGTFRNFYVYPTVESCADIMAASNPPVADVGAFTQLAFRFEGMRLKADSSADVRSANNVSTYECIDGGAVAITIEIRCDNVADCEGTTFPLYYSTDGTNFNLPVPNAPSADGVYFYGDSGDADLNRFVADGPLESGLTHTDGGTIVSASTQQSYDLAQNQSLTVRYLVAFASGISGSSRWFRVKLGSGNALGTYTATPRVTIVAPRASGGY